MTRSQQTEHPSADPHTRATGEAPAEEPTNESLADGETADEAVAASDDQPEGVAPA